MSTFTIRDIPIDLFDGASVENAIAQINEIKNRLQPALEHLVKELAEHGVEIARAQLVDLGAYETGALWESVNYEVDGDHGTISAGEGLTNAMGEPTNYAWYVEYGNMHKRSSGWYYPDPSGKRLYQGKTYSFTQGMSGRPFMHNTRNELIKEAQQDGGRIIAEYLA